MQAYLNQQVSSSLSQYIEDFSGGDRIVNHNRILEFVKDVASAGLILKNFQWSDWYHNSHLVDRPEYIIDATEYECMLLLTAMTRLEKFSPGVLDNMRRKGVLLAIIERLQSLRSHRPN